jgi:hypothetical protein
MKIGSLLRLLSLKSRITNIVATRLLGGRRLRGNLAWRGCGDHGLTTGNFSLFCGRLPHLAKSSREYELAAANSYSDMIRVLGMSEFLNFRLL